MAVYTKEVATEFAYPNITVYRQLNDGVQFGWEIRANEGYVFYDTTANDTEWNEELMEEVPVIYYKTVAGLPLRYNFDNFPYVAVPRDSVDENYIFGGGDNDDHETI